LSPIKQSFWNSRREREQKAEVVELDQRLREFVEMKKTAVVTPSAR
jgi:hypothetical protein